LEIEALRSYEAAIQASVQAQRLAESFANDAIRATAEAEMAVSSLAPTPTTSRMPPLQRFAPSGMLCGLLEGDDCTMSRCCLGTAMHCFEHDVNKAACLSSSWVSTSRIHSPGHLGVAKSYCPYRRRRFARRREKIAPTACAARTAGASVSKRTNTGQSVCRHAALTNTLPGCRWVLSSLGLARNFIQASRQRCCGRSRRSLSPSLPFFAGQ